MSKVPIDLRLISAVNEKDLPLLKKLLASGMNPDTANSVGETPLMFATSKPSEFTKVLLKAGSNPNSFTYQTRITPLIRSINSGNTEVVNLLLKAGADPNMANKRGGTPLAMASRINNIEMIQLLYEAGANIPSDVFPVYINIFKNSLSKKIKQLAREFNSFTKINKNANLIASEYVSLLKIMNECVMNITDRNTFIQLENEYKSLLEDFDRIATMILNQSMKNTMGFMI